MTTPDDLSSNAGLPREGPGMAQKQQREVRKVPSQLQAQQCSERKQPPTKRVPRVMSSGGKQRILRRETEEGCFADG